MSERVDKHGASAILGVPARTVVALAPSIPGSGKIGRGWTFDVALLRKYVRDRCERPQGDVSGAMAPSGVEPRLRAGTESGLYEQTIRSLLGKGGKPSEPKQKDKKQNCVYFIEAGDFVKIGRAKCWRSRMGGLQTGNPNKLNLLRVIKGAARKEYELHARFAHLRANGEWFRKEPELVNFINSLNDLRQ